MKLWMYPSIMVKLFLIGRVSEAYILYTTELFNVRLVALF